MIAATDDALQRRLARFVANAGEARSFAGEQKFFLGTTVGAIRQQNQDRALYATVWHPVELHRNCVIGIVCDGMGGLANGEAAAILSVSVFMSRVLRTSRLPIHERLALAASEANRAVYTAFSGQGGSTLSAVWIGEDGRAAGVNVGDSRIYGISGSRSLEQLSRDDTLSELLGRDAAHHDDHKLVQFIGMGEGIEPHIIDIVPAKYRQILITSDGIHNAPRDQLDLVVRDSTGPQDLIHRLIALNGVTGGRDNGTALSMPESSRERPLEYDSGLNIRFWSTKNSLEIWIPGAANDSKQDTLTRSFTEEQATHLPKAATPKKTQGQTKKTSRPKQKKRNAKRANSKRTEPRLPLEDVRPLLDVQFPDKGDDDN